MSLQLEGRRILVVSPHFDDVPLSLGESLLHGELSRAASVRVRVVFGATNWTTVVHPTRGRRMIVSAWRRAEEVAAALRFGYSFRAAHLEEVILRTGSLEPDTYRDAADLSAHPLVDRITPMVRRWSEEADVVLVPAGLGSHVDHRLVARAGLRCLRAGVAEVAFYEDRPYTAYLDDVELRSQLDELGVRLEPQDVSGPISAATQRSVARIYRSQMDEFFRDAQRRDRDGASVERIWVPLAPGRDPAVTS